MRARECERMPDGQWRRQAGRLFGALLVLLLFAPADVPAAEPSAGTGRRIDIGGYRLNIVCAGHGSPTVVFDAGLEDWSPSWSRVAPAVARVTRTCAYDRAGYGASDRGPEPRTSARIVTELHALLRAGGERPPYIVVGHSFGGENMRLFADRYLSEVAGIVLVDSSHEDQEPVFAAAVPHAAAQWRAMLETLRGCESLAARGLLARRPASHRTCASEFFRGLPEPAFSPAVNALLWRQTLAPGPYAAALGEARTFATQSAAEVRRARRSYGATPLRILTAMHHFADTSATPADRRAREARAERQWRALQRSWLALSSNARQTLATRSGHYVQLDQPALVIAAIRDELALARTHAARGVSADVHVHHVVERRQR